MLLNVGIAHIQPRIYGFFINQTFFSFILEHLLFRACAQTALQSFPQMSFVWQYYVNIQGSTLMPNK